MPFQWGGAAAGRTRSLKKRKGPSGRRCLRVWTVCSARFPDRAGSVPEEPQRELRHPEDAGSVKLPRLWLHASASALKFGKADAHPASGKKTGDNYTKYPISFMSTTVMSPEESMIWKETDRKNRIVDTVREGQGGTTWERTMETQTPPNAEWIAVGICSMMQGAQTLRSVTT